MSADNIRSALGSIAGELRDLESELDDAQSTLTGLGEEHDQLLDDLQRLIDTWYRRDLKDAEGNYAVHAEALETIVKKYQ